MAVETLDSLSKKARETYKKAKQAIDRKNYDFGLDMLFGLLDLYPKVMPIRELIRVAELTMLNSKSPNHFLSSLTGLGVTIAVFRKMRKNPQEALQAAERLLRKDVLNKPFLNLHAKAALAAGMPEVAIQTMELARDSYPEDLVIIRRLGEIYMKNDMIDKACDCYRRIAYLKPNDQAVQRELRNIEARLTMKVGKYGTATTVELAGEEQRVLASDKKSDAAAESQVAELLTRIKEEPQNLNLRTRLADNYSRIERYDDAIEAMNEAVKITGGSDPELDKKLTDIKLSKMDYDIKVLEDQGDAEGAKQKEQERSDFMLATAQERVRRYPNELQFKFELGILLYECGDVNAALQQFQFAKNHPQYKNRAVYYLALCFKAKKQYDMAVEQLEMTIVDIQTMNKDKKEIIYELGVLYELMSKRDKALEYFKQIYQVDMGFREVQQKVEQSYNQ